MNPFERHGVTHLSPSSIRLHREDPLAWSVRYLLRVKDDAGPGAWRGQAVEAGLNRHLYGFTVEDQHKAMDAAWIEQGGGQVDDRAEAERALLPAFLEQAKRATEGIGMPLTYQSKVVVELPGLSVPVIGFTDWQFDDFGLDLKTTKAMPSAPKPDHVEQMALYATATGKPFSLLYVTPKKFARYHISEDEVVSAMASLRRGALAIQAFLDRIETGEDAVRMFSPRLDSYVWSAPMVEAVNRIHEGV